MPCTVFPLLSHLFSLLISPSIFLTPSFLPLSFPSVHRSGLCFHLSFSRLPLISFWPSIVSFYVLSSSILSPSPLILVFVSLFPLFALSFFSAPFEKHDYVIITPLRPRDMFFRLALWGAREEPGEQRKNRFFYLRGRFLNTFLSVRPSNTVQEGRGRFLDSNRNYRGMGDF